MPNVIPQFGAVYRLARTDYGFVQPTTRPDTPQRVLRALNPTAPPMRPSEEPIWIRDPVGFTVLLTGADDGVFKRVREDLMPAIHSADPYVRAHARLALEQQRLKIMQRAVNLDVSPVEQTPERFPLDAPVTVPSAPQSSLPQAVSGLPPAPKGANFNITG